VSELTPYPRGASEREAAQEPQAPDQPRTDVVYSGWWRRAGALLVDSLLVFGVIAVVFGLAFGVAAVDETIGGILLLLAIVLALAGPIWYWIYYTGRAPGQTVGKRALGIRVRHAEEDRAIGYGASAGRYFITFLFGIFYIPALLDYLWPLWDSRNQTLHDKVANSVVVRA
jgi:uncharacterized RDD family membrane protein YckC